MFALNMRFRIPIVRSPTGSSLQPLSAAPQSANAFLAQFDTLGLGGGSTLLAGISFFIGVPAPYLMFKYGEKLRNASRHAASKT